MSHSSNHASRWILAGCAVCALAVAGCGPAAKQTPTQAPAPEAQAVVAPPEPAAPAVVVPPAEAYPAGALVADFETDAAGKPPVGWTMSETAVAAGYTVAVSERDAHQGKRCAEMRRGEATPAGDSLGEMRLPLDLERFRGRRLKLSVALRSEGQSVRSQIWFRVKRPGGGPLRLSPLHTVSAWGTYELAVEVPADATEAIVSLGMRGLGSACFDRLIVEVLGVAGEGNEPPRALGGRALENLVAFARLYGYVRYFHPSDEAAATDWPRFVIDGVRFVEDAQDAKELADRLSAWFAPIAPTVVVYPTGTKAPAPAKDMEGKARIEWRHRGVGISKQSTYSSQRVTSDKPDDEESGVYQELDATPYRGKTLRLRAWVRTEGKSPRARIGIAVSRAKALQVLDEMQDRPVSPVAWQEVTVELAVPEDGEHITVMLMLEGEGTVWFDDVGLQVASDEQATLALQNPDMEKPTRPGQADGWQWYSELPGAQHEASRAKPRAGKLSLAIRHPQRQLFPTAPSLFPLGAGVTCSLPVSLPTDGKETLPRATAVTPTLGARPPGWAASLDDRATRIADVIIAWNVFQHFFPYFDVVRTDWPAQLPRALAGAALAADGDGQQQVVERLVAALQDGHGRVWGGSSNDGYAPIRLRLLGKKLVVIAVRADVQDLVVGDVVRKIGGRPAAQVYAEAGAQVSAATPGYKDHVTAARLTRGRVGSKLALEVEGKDGKSRVVQVAYVDGGGDATEVRPANVAELEPGIWYVNLDKATEKELEDAMPRLAEAKGVVFDLRGYPGTGPQASMSHLIEARVRSATWRIPFVVRPDRLGMAFTESSWPVEPKQPRLSGRIVFLIDGRAISYAETYMGIIEHYKLAIIVGEPTAGTNGNVNPFALPSGLNVSWTGMKVLKHDGSRLHGVGIQPNIRSAPTLAGVRAGRDEVLERGVQAAKTGR